MKIEWGDKGFTEIEGSDFILKADVIFLAMGFLRPEQTGMIEELSLDTDPRSNVATNHYATSAEGIFSAGDMRRGQSLVVWAIHEGRECAIAVDEYLSKKPTLLNARSKSLYEKR